jgi:N-acetylneuraminate synthase
MVMSTGMASFIEIEDAVNAARRAGASEITLLKCTSAYPADAKDSNLDTMESMGVHLGCNVGISDHTLGIGVAIAAAALGADMIEKHITLDHQPGPDSQFSLLPQEFKHMVDEIRRAVNAIGQVQYGPSQSELHSLQFRRSLYVVKDVKAGEILTVENMRPMRPALGIEPKHYEVVLGHPVTVDVPAGTPLTWELID